MLPRDRRLEHQPQDKVLRAFPRSLHYHVGMRIYRVGGGGFGIEDANPREASRSLHWAKLSSSLWTRAFAVKRGAPQPGDFRQLASLQAFPGTTVPVRTCGTLRRGARVIPSLSAPSETLARLRLLLILFCTGRQEPKNVGKTVVKEETKESSTERRHKKILREIHGRTVTAGALCDLTRRQRVPLSYQLIAGRFLSPWDVFSHGLQPFPLVFVSLSISHTLLPTRHRCHDVRVLYTHASRS